MQKGDHTLIFISNPNKSMVHISESWTGHIPNPQEESIYNRTIPKTSARSTWKKYQAKGCQIKQPTK